MTIKESDLIGESLLDKFALAAVSGILSSSKGIGLDSTTVAEKSYEVATAMMEKRLERTKSRYGKKE